MYMFTKTSIWVLLKVQYSNKNQRNDEWYIKYYLSNFISK